jgi:hypothetical protein
MDFISQRTEAEKTHKQIAIGHRGMKIGGRAAAKIACGRFSFTNASATLSTMKRE